jgi:thiol-disulfide isomerase/thioredoxin
MRTLSTLVLALLLTVTLRAGAADPEPPNGFWKLIVPVRGGDIILMVAFTEQDGKWIGDYLASTGRVPPQTKVKNLKINGDVVQFSLDAGGQELLSFDGILSKDKKKITGSLSIGGQLELTELRPTKLKSLDDPYDIARETLTQVEGGSQLFNAALEVLAKAGEKKLPADEVRAILDRVNKAATEYGPRWERETALRLVEVLVAQPALGDVAIAQAKRAERLLSDDDDAVTRIKVIGAVADALTRANKADEAKPYLAQLAKLEARDYAEYVKTFPFKFTPYAGRKGKSDRTVLVELFTGAECPPCVAVDLAFDGLMKTFKPTDVVLLQYHIHVPGPDPLTSPDGMKRTEEFYGDQIRGAPTVFVSGKLGPAGGGPASAAEKKYQGIREQIEAELEKPAAVKLALTVAKAEKGGYTAKATVSDLETPGEKVMLRFALAEERVRYTGGNGIRYHHMVVRSMPGGIKGFPLTNKSAEQTVSFDPNELKKELRKYLEDFARTEEPFPRADRPLALKNLKLIAFVQNDATKEILQAVQVDVGEK